MSEDDFRVHFPENRSLFSFYTLKKVLKILFALMIVGLFVILIVRSISIRGSREMQAYLWTKEAMEAAEKDDFQVYEVSVLNQPSVNATFAVSNVYYTEPTGQLQFLLSYNLSKLESWAYKLELKEVPKSGDELFAFVLTDSEGNRYTEYEYVTDKLFFNGFYRLVFNGVQLTAPTVLGTVTVETGEEPVTEQVTAQIPIETLRLCVYYVGNVDFEGEKMDEMTVYQYGYAREEISPKLPQAPMEGILSATVTEAKKSEQSDD